MARSREEQGFVGRWARRKEQARRGEAPADEPVEGEATDPEAAEASAEDPSEAAALSDADMPDLDSLGPDSDVSPFFSSGVSEELRRKALRRLFHTSRFNVKDGLDDYDDDYRAYQPLGNVITSEMRRQQERMAERRRERDERAAEAAVRAEAAEQPAAEPAGEAPLTAECHDADSGHEPGEERGRAEGDDDHRPA